MPQMKESNRLNYKAEIRNYLSLGLTPETIARTLGQSHNLSRSFVYKKISEIRQGDNILAETKDRTALQTDINSCKERLSLLFRNAVTKIQDTNTNQFAAVSYLKIAQEIALNMLKLDYEGVQVMEAINSQISAHNKVIEHYGLTEPTEKQTDTTTEPSRDETIQGGHTTAALSRENNTF